MQGVQLADRLTTGKASILPAFFLDPTISPMCRFRTFRQRMVSVEHAYGRDLRSFWSAPDSGLTVALLGMSLAAMGVLRRRFVRD